MLDIAAALRDNKFDEVEKLLHTKTAELVAHVSNAIVEQTRMNIIRHDAILTGDMYRSVGWDYRSRKLASKVSVKVHYAVYVHEGTDRMPARPFFREARDTVERNIGAHIRATIGGAFR